MCHSNVQISNDTVYSYLRKFEVAFVFENEHNYEKWWIGLQRKLHTNNNSISSFYQFDVDIYPHQISIFSLVFSLMKWALNNAYANICPYPLLGSTSRVWSVASLPRFTYQSWIHSVNLLEQKKKNQYSQIPLKT